MRDFARALQELRDALADAQREISILEQTTGELKAIADRSGEGEIDTLLDRHLDRIDKRMAMALSRHAYAQAMLDSCASVGAAVDCPPLSGISPAPRTRRLRSRRPAKHRRKIEFFAFRSWLVAATAPRPILCSASGPATSSAAALRTVRMSQPHYRGCARQ